jgi:hypothetical protein
MTTMSLALEFFSASFSSEKDPFPHGYHAKNVKYYAMLRILYRLHAVLK